MELSKGALIALSEQACTSVTKAGELIKSFADKPFERSFKEGGHNLASQVVTEVDYKAERLILDHLQSSIEHYDFAVLTEEQEDNGQRLVKDYFWCVDPLDGTLAFTELEPGYAVSVALVSRDGTPVIAAVYDPVNSVLYSAIKDMGAWRNGKPLNKNTLITRDVFTLSCDHSLLLYDNYPVFLEKLSYWVHEQGYASLDVITGGGAVMNACRVVELSPGCYFKPPKPQAGGGCSWDFAASACLYSELGWPVSDFSGKTLSLNPSGPTFMNHCGVFYASSSAFGAVVRDLWLTSTDEANLRNS